MNRNLRKLSLLLTACGAVAIGVGCSGPGTTNNDQGLAVTHLGFFSALTTACTGFPAGVSGLVMQMSTNKTEPTSTITTTNLAGVDTASNLVAVVGVQNNLSRQIFRADRVIYDYFIAGASIQPPSTNVAVNLLAGPGSSTVGGATATDPTNGGRSPIGSSLPPNFSNLCNRAYGQVLVVPASVREWMNFNRDALPEPPFQMEVTARISGLSSAGDRFETQVAGLPVSVVNEVLVTPTEGDGDTGASGLENGTSEEATSETTTDASITDGTDGGVSSDTPDSSETDTQTDGVATDL